MWLAVAPLELQLGVRVWDLEGEGFCDAGLSLCANELNKGSSSLVLRVVVGGPSLCGGVAYC